MADPDEMVLRYNSFALDEEHVALRESYRTFFEKQCPPERVRQAEPLGWYAELWAELDAVRPVTIGVPEEAGGDGGGLVELALVCEEAGRAAAPVPLVESMVAARLLASLGGEAAATALADVLGGSVATVAPVGPAAGGRHLVPAGAVAPIVLGMHGDDLVLLRQSPSLAVLPNLARAPLAWCDLAGGTVLASGAPARAAFADAGRDWRLLLASSLVGLGASALANGVQYAKDREAFGVPIGIFQAIAHPLADVAGAIEGARRLTLKACWFADREPDELGALASMAFVHASEAAERAGVVAIHTQGGFGFTLESDVQLFYRRAKGWSLMFGDRRAELRTIGRHAVETGGAL